MPRIIRTQASIVMATSSELGEEASTLVEEEKEEGRSSESGEDQSAELQEYCEQV